MKVEKFILIIFLFAFLNAGISQVDYTVSYWPLIYNAETAIVEKDLSSALTNYQNAFRVTDKAFAIDLVNATVCASKLDSISTAFHFLHTLVLKGVSEVYLREFQGFEKIRLDPKWKDFISSYDALRSSVQFNDRLYVQLDSLSEMDQKFRIAPGSYGKYGDTIAKIDESNIIFLIEIIKKNGFPNEHILGTEYPQINFPGEIIFIHNCEQKSFDASDLKYNFAVDFYTAVEKGELDPHRMAQLLSLQGKYAPRIGQNTVMYLSINGLDSEPFRQKVNQEMISSIDEYRVRIGLENQSDFYRKAVFQLIDPRATDYEFKRYSQYEVFEVDEATYIKLLNVFEPLIPRWKLVNVVKFIVVYRPKVNGENSL